MKHCQSLLLLLLLLILTHIFSHLLILVVTFTTARTEYILVTIIKDRLLVKLTFCLNEAYLSISAVLLTKLQEPLVFQKPKSHQ